MIPDLEFGTAQGRLHKEQNQTVKFDINVIVIPPAKNWGGKSCPHSVRFFVLPVHRGRRRRLSDDYVQRLKAALQAPRAAFRHRAYEL